MSQATSITASPSSLRPRMRRTAAPRIFERDQRRDIEAALIGERAPAYRWRRPARALLRQEARGVPADGAEPLDREPRALQRQPKMLAPRPRSRRRGRSRSPRSRRGGFRPAPAAAHGPADFVLDPGHRQFVGPHVGAGDVVDEVAIAVANARISRSLRRAAFCGSRRSRTCRRHAAARRQRFSASLPARAESFLGADIGRHAHAADRRTANDVVDRDNGLRASSGARYERALSGPFRRQSETHHPSHPLRPVHRFKSHKISDTTRLTPRHE